MPTINNMNSITLRELYTEGVNALKSAGIAEAENDARLLLEYACEVDRNAFFVHGDDEVLLVKITKYRELINQRSIRIPLQHIVGSVNFMGLDFVVNEHVLIPRWDTECLVEEALIHVVDGDRVLDMCTGSGCILLSIMNYNNDISGVGVDISKEALAVARRNAEIIRNNENVEFIESNLFESLPNEYINSFDMIVSNPPYIRPDVIETLEPEVKNHEPRIALDGGEDGLIFYRKISKEAGKYLKKGGYLLYEIGYDQADAVSGIMEENGFKEVKVVKDLAGLDRVVSGYFGGNYV